ncbi:lantibiotic dehydratase [Streptomyces sp. NPDC002577]
MAAFDREQAYAGDRTYACDRTYASARAYECGDTVVLRASLAPRTLAADAVTGPRPPDDPARLEGLRRAVHAASPQLMAALELASPDLIRALTGPVPPRAADRRRLTLALTGYLLRLRHRATPFGLLAGTALIGTGPVPLGGIGSDHHVHLRPAPQWTADLVAALEADPELPRTAPQVRIATAPTVRRRGALQLLLDRATGSPGAWTVRTTVRRSPLVDTVLALAAADGAAADGAAADDATATGADGPGIRHATLLALLSAAAPDADRDELARCVAGLLAAGLLAGDLLPQPGDTDPLAHLGARLAGHPLADRLRGLRRDVRRAAARPDADALRGLRRRLHAVHAVHGREAGLVADTVLDTDLRLPRAVVDEVEHAAATAWALAPPRPDRTLAALRLAILDRYGIGRPIPLPELLDPTESLGLHTPPRPPADPPPHLTARDRLLTRLALDAQHAGRAELRLDRATIHRLRTVTGVSAVPPSTDVFAEVVTDSAEALARGGFLVVLAPHGGQGPAGAVAGRHADLFGTQAPGLFQTPAPAPTPAPIEAEVVFRPPAARATDLVGETGRTAYRIDLTPLPRRRTSRDLTLDDLYVIAEPDRLRLHSARLGREIRPISHSALDPRHADATARLLLALGRDGATPWTAWDWGTADALPWLPRVRVGRAVLAPARWRLPPDLGHLAEVATEQEWRDGLARWQTAHGLPEVVLAGSGDRRLALEPADPAHAELLRRECLDRRITAVTEPPGGVAAWRTAGWPTAPDGPHTAEFVFPLRPRASHPETPPSRGPRQAHAAPTAPAAPVHLPGGPWLCAGLTALPELQDSVLRELADGPLREAVERAGVDRWFFVRAADPAGVPELRLRFHGRPASLTTLLLPVLHDVSTQLRHDGLIRDFVLAPYRPEEARYGGSACMAAAEEVFHRDSLLVLERLASMTGTADPAGVAAAGAHDLLAGLLGSQDAVARLPAPRLSAAERRRFTRLRPAQRGQPPAPVETHDRGAHSARADWHAAVLAYRSRLLANGEETEPVARSLVHMHCNRLAGPDRSVERIAVTLARDLARSRAAGRR